MSNLYNYYLKKLKQIDSMDMLFHQQKNKVNLQKFHMDN
nr:MAG TPA: hypothetical protein [Bacteriophage sp.]